MAGGEHYNPEALPAYGDIASATITGDCCEPVIFDGDTVLVSHEAAADVEAGGYVVTEPLRGVMRCYRVTRRDGLYYHLGNNSGDKVGCMEDFIRGAVVGVVRDGETIAVSLD